ncbi:MAG: TraI domain-containing protein [Saccharospirillaceae bacterium]|nr:TraI domain-containing protein [Saccharospirillaceae bacterium]
MIERIKKWLKRDEITLEIRKKKFSNSMIAESGYDLLARQHKKIDDIRVSLSLTDDRFDRFYAPLFARFAEVSQCMPASENHHHAHKYGFLDHSLEVAVVALRKREGVIYKQDQESQLMTKREVFSYAVVVAAIMHDIGKLITDIEIFSVEEQRIIHYASGERLSTGDEFVYRFFPGRRIEDHQASALILLNQLVPSVGMSWLCTETELFREVIHTITSSHKFSGKVGQLITESDQVSTANNLARISVNFKASHFAHSPSALAQVSNRDSSPSQNSQNKAMMIANNLKHMLENPTDFGGRKLLNIAGSFAWVKDEFIYMSHPLAFKLLHEYMSSENAKSTPNSANICYSILFDSGFLVKSNNKMFDFYHVSSNDDDWTATLAYIKLDRDKMDPSRLLPESNHSITLSPKKSDVVKKNGTASKSNTPSKKLKNDKTKNENENEEGGVDEKSNAENIEPELNKIDAAVDSIIIMQPLNNTTGNPIDELLAPKIITENIDKTAEFSNNETFNIFLKWLTHQFRHKTIDINKHNAAVHVVDTKIVLVSPRVFIDFIKSNAGNDLFNKPELISKTPKQRVNYIQAEFFKSNEHERSVLSENILTFELSASSKKRTKLSGVLLKPDMSNYLLNDKEFSNSRHVFLQSVIHT